MPKGIAGRAHCSIEDCDKLVHGHGLCTMHTLRIQRHGDLSMSRRAKDERDFWARVDKDPDGCWIAAGHVTSAGYAAFGARGGRAHRFTLEQALGRPIKAGMQALHTCDVKLCVRNDPPGTYVLDGVARPCYGHLWEGTNQENTADRVAKERSAFGERNGDHLYPERRPRGVTQWRARFTEDEIRDIRRRAEAGERHIDIAADYRAGTSTIHHIIHRESWRHVV